MCKECSEFEEVRKILNAYEKSWETLKRVLGENRKTSVKIGDVIPAGISGWGKTKVSKIYKDLPGSEIWATELTLKKHLEDELALISPATARHIIPSIFKKPDLVLYDKNSGGSIRYAKVKTIRKKKLFLFAVVASELEVFYNS